ncbi:zf-CCHC domain-containing protein [Tanacetum coccineum]
MGEIHGTILRQTRADYGRTGVDGLRSRDKENFETKRASNYIAGTTNWRRLTTSASKLDENLYQAWERFKKLLMKCPQHYLTKILEVVLFYNGWDVPTRQILDLRGAIPSKTVADAKVPTYTKDFPSRKKGLTLEEVTTLNLFLVPFQEGDIRANAMGFIQRNNVFKRKNGLDLEAKLIGDTLVLNRSLEPFFGDYIELNDLNVPLELRRDQVDDLMPTIEEGEVIEEFRARNDARMMDNYIGGNCGLLYPEGCWALSGEFPYCLNRSMDLDKYLEGQSMKRPPLFESDHFIYWKNIFETYVKAKDLDLWHIIWNGDFPSLAKNEVTQILEVVPFEQQDDDLKKKFAKNNEAKMVLYNALPKKEYERIFKCKTAKDIWKSLLITHQEEYIDSGFARFNTIITSLKALDEGFSSKNYVRKFLRALYPKWRAKVKAIEESKDLSSLALDELIGNLKVHEVFMEKDFEIYKGKKERIKYIALKAKKESSDDETSTSGSDDEEYAMAVRNFKKFFKRNGKFVRQPREENMSFRQRDDKKRKSDRKCFRCGDPNHLLGDCSKPPLNKYQKAFVGGCWKNSENEAGYKTINETCLMAQSSNEVTLDSSQYSENASSFDDDSMQIEYDNLCDISLKIINKNKILKIKKELLEKEIIELNEKIKKLKRNKEVDIGCDSCQQLRLENAKLKENHVKFDKSANSLREMLNIQKPLSCKIGLGVDKSNVSTSRTKPMSFVGSTTELAGD